MTTLHLGVVEIPYANAGGKTTGDVADILEAKYHVMEVFYEDLGPTLIAKSLEVSVVNAVESMMLGAPATISLTGDAEQEIEQAFRLFLSQQEMDGQQPGVPTKASLKGVNHRLKKPNAKTNLGRPSFIDTGLYQRSFKAWVD